MRRRSCGLLGVSGETERGVVPRLSVKVPAPAKEATFHWEVEPEDGYVSGVLYPDGSRLDGPSAETARNGWSFVCLDSAMKVTASAYGLPPDWVDDIPGSEAWGVYEAASRSVMGNQFRADCRPCMQDNTDE